VKIYVATKFENSKSAREAHEALKQDGHTITHDWTGENDQGLEGKVLEVYRDECAEHDVNGVLAGQGFLLLNHERLGHRMCIVVIDAFEEGLPRNIFFHLSDVHKAKDLSEARAIFQTFQTILDREK
jgi:hypothetical protein